MRKAFKFVLRFFFSRTFLKKSFLIYNKIKIDTWDRIFFKQLELPDSAFQIKEDKNPFLELDISIGTFSEEVRTGLTLWCNPKWKQDQYLLQYNEAGWIEPKTGWALTFNRRLILPSLGFAHAPHVHKPSWAETYINKKHTVQLGDIISLRDTGEENYFHFFNDIISKILFLKDQSVELKEYTIVISESLFKKSYFQYYVANTFMRSLKWHIQKDEWIMFKSAIFCKPYTHTKKYFVEEVNVIKRTAIGTKERRIFLTRRSGTLRFINNSDAIYDLLKPYNFEMVDTSELSFSDQVELFSNTRHLIAVHGAGITNIIFRNGEALDLLEIVPVSQYIPFHYMMLAKMYGYRYNITLGSPIDGHGGFDVNPLDVLLYLKNSGLQK